MRTAAMRIHTLARRSRGDARRVRVFAPGALLQRVRALRLRLAGRAARLAAGRRVAARVSPLDRVMRRSTAIHVARSFTTQVGARWLPATPVVHRTQTGQAPSRRTQAVPGPVHTLTQQLRTLVSRRVLHERLVERVARGEAPAPAARVSFVTRVEQRHAAPRIQLTMLRAPGAAAPGPAAAGDAAMAASVPWPAQERPTRIAPPAPPLVLPARELSRLTDHVIRQLDHRVLSWQERTGRV